MGWMKFNYRSSNQRKYFSNTFYTNKTEHDHLHKRIRKLYVYYSRNYSFISVWFVLQVVPILSAQSIQSRRATICFSVPRNNLILTARTHVWGWSSCTSDGRSVGQVFFSPVVRMSDNQRIGERRKEEQDEIRPSFFQRFLGGLPYMKFALDGERRVTEKQSK